MEDWGLADGAIKPRQHANATLSIRPFRVEVGRARV